MTEGVSFVIHVRRRTWAVLLFVLVLAYTGWFTYVLYGEQNSFGDDPGSWALIPTVWWAWIGLFTFFLVGLYFLMLLVRREVPARTYSIPDVAGSPEYTTPSFLQGGAEAQPPPEAPPPAEAPAPPSTEEKPEQREKPPSPDTS